MIIKHDSSFKCYVRNVKCQEVDVLPTILFDYCFMVRSIQATQSLIRNIGSNTLDSLVRRLSICYPQKSLHNHLSILFSFVFSLLDSSFIAALAVSSSIQRFSSLITPSIKSFLSFHSSCKRFAPM